MPFPLAHPAAILPLKRFCPRYFDFPALVIGSLCPDLGYCFGKLHLNTWSHSVLTGSFCFCLPIGLVLVFLFYHFRGSFVRKLPAYQRMIFEPICAKPAGRPLVIAYSLLIGAWTHIAWDDFTHEKGWFVVHCAILQYWWRAASIQIQLFSLLYFLSTFLGAFYLYKTYINWAEHSFGSSNWIIPHFKWVAPLLFAFLTLLLSVANHRSSSFHGLILTGFLTVLLFLFFILGEWMLPFQNPEHLPQKPRRRVA